MSHELKPGDRVICINNDNAFLDLQVGKEYVIREIRHVSSGDLAYLEGNDGGYYIYRFRPVDPIEEAKTLLEKEGYTVTPPKPKQKGQVVIYTIDDSSIRSLLTMPKDTWDQRVRDFSTWRAGRTILAIVDWEEGQGLK